MGVLLAHDEFRGTTAEMAAQYSRSARAIVRPE
jgi:hypothetical protein